MWVDKANEIYYIQKNLVLEKQKRVPKLVCFVTLNDILIKITIHPTTTKPNATQDPIHLLRQIMAT